MDRSARRSSPGPPGGYTRRTTTPVPAGRLPGAAAQLRLLVESLPGRRRALLGRLPGHGQPAAAHRGDRARPMPRAWMAFFARDMARIASELHDPATSQRYWVDRGRIQEAINTNLWDDSTGFYYDLGADGTLYAHKSYSGLMPLIAGVVPPERLPHILSALRDPNQFLATGGHSQHGRKRPAVHARESAAAASTRTGADRCGCRSTTCWCRRSWTSTQAWPQDVRDDVVNTVETDWNSTGRLHEFFDGDTGAGSGRRQPGRLDRPGGQPHRRGLAGSPAP